MNLGTKVFSNNLSKIIISFAFFYSALICHFKASELYASGETILSIVIWVCSFLSFIGALRFQIAKLIYMIKKKYGKK